ncbi:unnamed protein product [Meloidogyne enterolobii]|uniref:Uncharacterized protein n=1 Tax=Meloidogyne enterolobii TaxID=390850 RepID=A0ACB1AFL2_MELEN
MSRCIGALMLLEISTHGLKPLQGRHLGNECKLTQNIKCLLTHSKTPPPAFFIFFG